MLNTTENTQETIPPQRPCPVCHSHDIRILLPFPHRFKTEELVRCRECGLSWFNFQRSNRQETTVAADTSVFWETGVHYEAYRSEEALAAFSDRYARYLPLLDLTPGSSVLDVGCGLGSFMRYCEDQGLKPTGLEVDPQAAKLARQIVSGDVIVSTIRDYEIHGETFDAVALWDVIEHLVDPVGDLTRLTAALKPGGKLLIETPNERYFARKVALFFERLTNYRLRLGKYFYYVEHKFYFNPGNLARLLSGLGYCQIAVHQDRSIASREQHIFGSGNFPLARMITRLIPLALKVSTVLPHQNKMVVVATKSDV